MKPAGLKTTVPRNSIDHRCLTSGSGTHLQPTGRRPSFNLRVHHLHRGRVDLQVTATRQILANQILSRLERRCSDPIGQRGSRDFSAKTREFLLHPLLRTVFEILRQNHMSQEARTVDSFVDHPRRHRHLNRALIFASAEESAATFGTATAVGQVAGFHRSLSFLKESSRIPRTQERAPSESRFPT